MSLRLIIEDDEGATTIVPLESEAVTIGRQEGNTIQLTEKNVSRQHARLMQGSEGWIIEDLGSYNGSKVNGVPMEGRVTLTEGDVVQIGDYHLALCEDVDKKTLNLDRPARAANDQEPLLASSSAALPKLSQQELAELQSSAQPETAPDQTTELPSPTPVQGAAAHEAAASRPSTESSGSGAAMAARSAQLATPKPAQSGRSGAVAGVVAAVVVIAIAAGGAWMFLRPSDGGQTVAQNAPSQPVPAVAANEPQSQAQPPVAATGGQQADDDPQASAAAAGDPAEPNAEGEEEPVEILEVEDEDTQPDTATQRKSDRRAQRSRRARRARARRKRRSKNTKGSSKPPPPPPPAPPPPAPSSDPAQLLKDARVASLKGNHGMAYDLAKRAYEAKRSASALKVMGVAACKMGSVGKAKVAYRKLSGANKEGLAKVCEGQGISLQ